jgi:hypothetical protein
MQNMSYSQVIPYDDPENYIYDPLRAEIADSRGRPALVDLPSLEFEQLFLDDTGFVYDSDKSEFVFVKQYQDATFAANYTATINGTCRFSASIYR